VLVIKQDSVRILITFAVTILIPITTITNCLEVTWFDICVAWQMLEVQPAVEEVFQWFPPKGFQVGSRHPPGSCVVLLGMPG
jgi:hypothetical protein